MKGAKAAIVECAFRLFLERGYENTSMSDLVAATGLSKGAVYHHFKDKDALHDAAIHHFFIRFLLPDDREPAPAPKIDLEPVLLEMCDDYARLLTTINAITQDMDAYYRFLFAIMPKVRPTIVAQINAARARIAEAVQHDQKAGRLNPALDPGQIADQCLALIEGTGVLHALEQNRGDLDEAFRRAVGGYLDLLRAGRGPEVG